MKQISMILLAVLGLFLVACSGGETEEPATEETTETTEETVEETTEEVSETMAEVPDFASEKATEFAQEFDGYVNDFVEAWNAQDQEALTALDEAGKELETKVQSLMNELTPEDSVKMETFVEQKANYMMEQMNMEEMMKQLEESLGADAEASAEE